MIHMPAVRPLADSFRGVAETVVDDNLRAEVLRFCGYKEGAEVTAEGSYQNDLAMDRANVALAVLATVEGSVVPARLVSIRESWKPA
jgi:transposase-like protein